MGGCIGGERDRNTGQLPGTCPLRPAPTCAPSTKVSSRSSGSGSSSPASCSPDTSSEASRRAAPACRERSRHRWGSVRSTRVGRRRPSGCRHAGSKARQDFRRAGGTNGLALPRLRAGPPGSAPASGRFPPAGAGRRAAAGAPLLPKTGLGPAQGAAVGWRSEGMRAARGDGG